MIKLFELIEWMNPRGIEVRPIEGDDELDVFDNMVRKHYLGGAHKNINIRLGIFVDNKMIGIAAYGPPTFPLISKQLGLQSGEVYELRRFYTEQNHIHNLESQALSIANSELKNIKPNVKVVVTYADPQQGHIGTLYQATNAKYLGKGSGKQGKHKYIYILGNKSEKKYIENKIKDLYQNYPKKDEIPTIVNEQNFEYSETMRDYHSGQSYMTAYAKLDGETVGWCDYSIYDNKVYIDMLEVDKEYQRKGIATGLMNFIKKENEGKKIIPGMATDDGDKFWKAYTK